MKNVLIITARSNSSRLKNKHFLKINNKTIIQILVDRLKYLNNYSNIVIATTTNPEDDKFQLFCKKNKIDCFRGSENDVTGRVLKAATLYKAYYITLITGDCPLVDLSIIEQLYEMIKINKYDFVTNSDLRSYPDGMDVQIFKRSILNEISKTKLTKLEKEHVTLSIRRRKNKYKFFNLVAPKNLYWPELAVTLDEINDYYFLKEIVKKYKNNLRMISCEDIINIIRKNKKLLKLNNYIIKKGNN